MASRSRSIGGVHANLTLRDAQFSKGLSSARAGLNRFAKIGLTAAVAGTAALTGAMVVGSRRIIKMGADLDHMSTQTGVAVSSLIKIGQAYKDSGRDAGAAGKDIGRMQKAIRDASRDPGGRQGDAFRDMGLSIDALMSMSPEQQFFAIGEAINGIGNQTIKTAAAMDVFGRSGTGLLTVFKNSNMRDINASLGRMPEIMERFGGAMERVDTLMGRLPNKSDQFFAGFTSGVIGQLLPGLEKANNMDFTTLGESLGTEISFAMEAITSGDIWDIFGLRGTAAIIEFGEKLAMVVSSAMKAATSPDTKEMQKLGGIFQAGLVMIGGSDQAKKEMMDKIVQYHDAQAIAPSSGFMEIYKREMDKQSTSGIGDEMRAEADRIGAGVRRRVEGKKQAAEDVGMFQNSTIPGVGDIAAIVGEVNRIAAAAPDAAKADKSDPWRETSAAVNSMQARGLGMGSMLVPKEVKDTVSILREMLAVIKKNATADKPLTL